MYWTKFLKAGLGLTASLGITNIVGNAIKATTPANLNTLNKVTIAVGSFVLSGMLSDMAVGYLNAQVDSFFPQKPVEKKLDAPLDEATITPAAA